MHAPLRFPPSPPVVSAGRDSALEACGLGYRTPEGKHLLKEVSFRLEPGRILAVIGPNGAGKTTLLRLLASELTASSGQATLDGRPLPHWSAQERARRIAVLPQQSSLTAAFTSLEVVLLGRSTHPTQGEGPTDFAVSREALAVMDAIHLAERRYPSLSGGEKSRVQAARVLAQIWEPDFASRSDAPDPSPAPFLLLDEPTAALDIAHQHQFLTRVKSLARERSIGVLAILHDLSLASQYADDLLALKGGRTAAYGPIGTVFEAEMLSTVFGLPMSVIPHPRQGWPLAIPC